MKYILILVAMLTALLLSGCGAFDDDPRDAEISSLKTALDSQRGTREAELAFGERQASFYLGCKQFFNRCSPETVELGQKLLQNGFTGTTSAWYWLGLLAELICIAVAVAIFSAILRYLHLIAITPKEESVESAQRLVSEVDEYVAEGKRWRDAHEQKLLTEQCNLAQLVFEKEKKRKERDQIYQDVLDAYTELGSVQKKLKAAQQPEAGAKNSEDY